MSIYFVGQNFLEVEGDDVVLELRDLQELLELKILQKWKKKYGKFRLYRAEDRYGDVNVWCSWGNWAINIGVCNPITYEKV